MNNSNRFIFMYLFTIAFACNATQEKSLEYRSIPFNHEIIDQPRLILYNTSKNFAISGGMGYEIHRNKGFNTPVRCRGYWKLLKDGKYVAAFNYEGITIEHLDCQARDRTISMQQGCKCIIDVALDAAKNIIFIAYDHPGHKSGIRQYNYDRNYSSSDYPYNDYPFKNYAKCCSLALSPKKDILCLLDNYSDITLRKTNALGVTLKKITLPNTDSYESCIFSPDGNNLIVRGQQSIYVLDDYLNKNDIRPFWVDKGNPVALIKGMTFHPCGLLGILTFRIRNHAPVSILYVDPITLEKIDTTSLPGRKGHNFCFRDDGLEVALVIDNECTVGPVSLEVIKRYILPPLWMKFKMVQEQCGLSQDVLVHCMNVLTAHCSKKNYA